VKAFAQSRGRRAKTDRIDAELFAGNGPSPVVAVPYGM
jgi:transposase